MYIFTVFLLNFSVSLKSSQDVRSDVLMTICYVRQDKGGERQWRTKGENTRTFRGESKDILEERETDILNVLVSALTQYYTTTILYNIEVTEEEKSSKGLSI